MSPIHSFKRRTIIRLAGLLAFLLLIVYLVLSYQTSLYKTVPDNIPFWSSSLPSYRNQWSYTNPSTLRQPNPNFKAAYVTFTKGDRAALANLRLTVRNLEDSFNKDRHYPYIIFSNEHLSDEFKELASSLATGQMAFYDDLSSDYYGYGNTTDLAKAAEARTRMSETLFGDSEDYRFSSRFMAGMIFHHPALKELDYYWRFEAGTEYICPIQFDAFEFMYDHKKKLSFSMALYEYEETIPTLFKTATEFAAKHPEWVQPADKDDSLWRFIIDGETNGYNRCHFWSNFQIADLNFFRSEQYQAFFNYIDQSNGIFYERWGDPVIQSLGAVLFLEKSDVQHWENIGYRVANYFTHCPADKGLYSQCSCRPSQNFDFDGYSCLRFFKD
ncbi:nucleotide-diphospho-sugar transferase [Syncephalastrum racemosum]|uniref:Nucleotide-diphospho-sugar transferase n=1 Tax=Syncephalastrum racemosum TaxID=13706 RepID=A0A1X2HI79_SYNRA|nr:nucleotide-diphospho-sugar transferase [Syncephalastrum racemosum]